MTAASFALLQSFLCLFSARIGCRDSQTTSLFPFCSEPQVPSDARRWHSACRKFIFSCHGFGRGLAVGLPKNVIIFVPLRAASPIGRAAVSQRVPQIYLFLPWLWARIGCRGSPKNHYFRSAPSRKSHRTRGGVTARAANLSFPAMALGADWLSGLPTALRLHRERAWRLQPLRNRQCSHRQPDCPSCRILRQP